MTTNPTASETTWIRHREDRVEVVHGGYVVAAFLTHIVTGWNDGVSRKSELLGLGGA